VVGYTLLELYKSKRKLPMRTTLIAATALLLTVPVLPRTAAPATPADGFTFITHEDLVKTLMTPEPNRVYSAKVINPHDDFYTEFVKRLDHGNMVEQHAHFEDQITILSGEGVMTYGGVISNAKETGEGELRGDTQTGNTITKPLHPGDFVLIPAGVPHKFDAAPGKSLYYVVFKARV
jgi:mannose-6-phosphate isomerase-like protein (cupin superfamily)